MFERRAKSVVCCMVFPSNQCATGAKPGEGICSTAGASRSGAITCHLCTVWRTENSLDVMTNVRCSASEGRPTTASSVGQPTPHTRMCRTGQGSNPSSSPHNHFVTQSATRSSCRTHPIQHHMYVRSGVRCYPLSLIMFMGFGG